MTPDAARPDQTVPAGTDGRRRAEARALVEEILARFMERCPRAGVLAFQMKDSASTRLADWVDSIYIPHADAELRTRLRELGWERDKGAEVSAGLRHVLQHTESAIPPVVTMDGDFLNIAVRVERVADFLAAQRVYAGRNVGGRPGARTRWAMAFAGERAELWAIERHGYTAFGDAADRPRDIVSAERVLEKLRTRRRDFGVGVEADGKGLAHLGKILDAGIAELGRDWTADLFLQAERAEWMSRNRAARVQHARQQALGLGWAHAAHHAYRCGRANVGAVIGLFEMLGFCVRVPIEGDRQAGWSAQALEHPIGARVLLEVDARPGEHSGGGTAEGWSGDEPAPLGAVGRWVALHGESMLQGGMHRLACPFDRHSLRAQLQREAGIGMMDPCGDEPRGLCAFTEGERWGVRPARVEALLSAAQISPAEADHLRADGAVGSHLEVVDRADE